ncbi:MAG: thiamine pyrophosphate-dependent enzyme [Acidimicrobiia bacterium]|nr:thiamine pyrophosphate-dependent enzyme [Acidimicrobiia bacterium]
MSNATVQISLTLRDYLRADRMPTTWCAGCGLGIIMNAIVQAIAYRGLDMDQVSMVSGIGCTGRMSGYVDCNTVHTTHGRAPAFATGIKLAKPEMTVITVMGDGDAMSIGGNHLVHAMRRNIGMVAIVVNNNVYGLTGGQTSPTTPVGGVSTTAAEGSFERPMDLEALARTAGAPFFARATVNHTASLTMAIEKAFEIDGFALVEVISNCHVIYGRMNGMPEAADMIAAMDGDTWRTNPVLLKRADQSIRVTAGGVDAADGLRKRDGVSQDERSGRGVIWTSSGSVGLSKKYSKEIAARQGEPEA